MQFAVFSSKGETTTETVELKDSVFNIEPNDHCIYLDVRLLLANRRQGTHKTKERGEVSGSTRKPYRQKDTGNARAGHTRSPLWRHGGTIFGPRPRKYGFKLNRKVKQLARRSALSYKTREQKLLILERPQFSRPKTQEVIKLLERLKLVEKKLLFVTGQYDEAFMYSARNIKGVRVVNAHELNTYDIITVEQLVVMRDAVPVLHDFLGN